MSGGVADDGPLDYARIQIIPSENRFSFFFLISFRENVDEILLAKSCSSLFYSKSMAPSIFEVGWRRNRNNFLNTEIEII